MADKGFDLGNYVEVKDRIKLFYELFNNGRLVTDEVVIHTSPDGKQRVMVKALAYRSPEDSHPGVGHSWMELPGTTSYTRGSELENTETSAWGRAIGSLGILIDASIASAQEVKNKQGEPAAPREGSLIGIAKITPKRTSDGQLREEPDGHRLGFRLQARDGDRGEMLIEANDALASTLAVVRDEWVDKPVTVWGVIEPRSFTPNKPNAKPVTYQALVLSRIQTPTFTLPANDAGSQEATTEPPKADAAPGGQDEPPAGALSPEDEAELDLALT